jgi:hypothetical protein
VLANSATLSSSMRLPCSIDRTPARRAKSALAAAMIGGGAVAIQQGVGVLVDVVMTHR